jgi:hypothetical protein
MPESSIHTKSADLFIICCHNTLHVYFHKESSHITKTKENVCSASLSPFKYTITNVRAPYYEQSLHCFLLRNLHYCLLGTTDDRESENVMAG